LGGGVWRVPPGGKRQGWSENGHGKGFYAPGPKGAGGAIFLGKKRPHLAPTSWKQAFRNKPLPGSLAFLGGDHRENRSGCPGGGCKTSCTTNLGGGGGGAPADPTCTARWARLETAAGGQGQGAIGRSDPDWSRSRCTPPTTPFFFRPDPAPLTRMGGKGPSSRGQKPGSLASWRKQTAKVKGGVSGGGVGKAGVLLLTPPGCSWRKSGVLKRGKWCCGCAAGAFGVHGGGGGGGD